jgi:hypothetical protein
MANVHHSFEGFYNKRGRKIKVNNHIQYKWSNLDFEKPILIITLIQWSNLDFEKPILIITLNKYVRQR